MFIMRAPQNGIGNYLGPYTKSMKNFASRAYHTAMREAERKGLREAKIPIPQTPEP